jgi:hypothetical protein
MIDRLFFPTLMLSLAGLTVLIAGEAFRGPPSERAAQVATSTVELPRVVITAPRLPLPTDVADAEARARTDPAGTPRMP